MNRPVMTIVAGSNGCGKTSLTTFSRANFQQIPILDPDAVALSLYEATSHAHSDIEAGKQVLRRAEELLEARQSFTVETTLSGSTYLKMASRAREAGFIIVMYFIGTSSVEINIERVKARVRKGGHDISEEDQRRRYPRTLQNITKLLPLADFAVFFDNSTDQGHQLVAAGHADFLHLVEPLPEWASFLRPSSLSA